MADTERDDGWILGESRDNEQTWGVDNSLRDSTPTAVTVSDREIKLIDLDQFRTPGVGVFAGRDRATAIRKSLGINDGDWVELRVPNDVYCLAAGFADTLLWNLTLNTLKAPRVIFAQISDAGMDTSNVR